jgi:hypothetical protein
MRKKQYFGRSFSCDFFRARALFGSNKEGLTPIFFLNPSSLSFFACGEGSSLSPDGFLDVCEKHPLASKSIEPAGSSQPPAYSIN